jgi:hypothetical protein
MAAVVREQGITIERQTKESRIKIVEEMSDMGSRQLQIICLYIIISAIAKKSPALGVRQSVHWTGPGDEKRMPDREWIKKSAKDWDTMTAAGLSFRKNC